MPGSWRIYGFLQQGFPVFVFWSLLAVIFMVSSSRCVHCAVPLAFVGYIVPKKNLELLALV